MWVILIVVLSRLLNKDRLIDSETTVDESTIEKKGLARTPFKRDKKKFYREKRAVFANAIKYTHSSYLFLQSRYVTRRHYKREIACSVVLRAPFRRTSPNLQRPFLSRFLYFSFVCFVRLFPRAPSSSL